MISMQQRLEALSIEQQSVRAQIKAIDDIRVPSRESISEQEWLRAYDSELESEKRQLLSLQAEQGE